MCVCVCAHFRNTIFRGPVGRPHGSIPTHFSCALSPPSLPPNPAFFVPLSSSVPPSFYIFISLAFVFADPAVVPSFLARSRRPNSDRRFSRSPGPLRRLRETAVSLAILTSRDPQIQVADRHTDSSCLLLPVMEKGAISRLPSSVDPFAQTLLRKRTLSTKAILLLSSLLHDFVLCRSW